MKKIVLFDVTPRMPFNTKDVCNGFDGRIKQELSRAVEQVKIKASFYNANHELIEVKTFWFRNTSGLDGRVFPNTPVSFSFSNLRDAQVRNLPVAWKYKLEVAEARYVSDPTR